MSTDGSVTSEQNELVINGASEITLVLGAFVGRERAAAFSEIAVLLDREFDYDKELSLHIARHAEFYNGVDFSISAPDTDTSNEELLLDAYESEPSMSWSRSSTRSGATCLSHPPPTATLCPAT